MFMNLVIHKRDECNEISCVVFILTMGNMHRHKKDHRGYSPYGLYLFYLVKLNEWLWNNRSWNELRKTQGKPCSG